MLIAWTGYGSVLLHKSLPYAVETKSRGSTGGTFLHAQAGKTASPQGAVLDPEVKSSRPSVSSDSDLGGVVRTSLSPSLSLPPANRAEW